jgi:hypothetical protein
MGLLRDIGKIILGGALGGPAGAILVSTVQHGDKAIKITVDVARQIVKIGTDVYRAIPPEAFALAGFPLHGLLKHEFEDEIILLGEIAGEIAITSALSWPVLGPVGASLAIAQGGVPLYVTAGSVVGKLDHRVMNDEEWAMAQYIFRDSLYNRDDIILTNLGGLGGAAFVYPSTLGPVFVNLGNKYVHNATIRNGPVLFHELTHVWQAKQRVLREVFLYDALPDAGDLEAYDFTPGDPWHKYNTEQQASIVEAWTNGATEKRNAVFNKGVRGRLTLNSPIFRYINGNVRRSDNGASVGRGNSVKQLLADGGHRTIKDMHSKPPTVWW